jgi:hypothetical protein
MAMATLRVSLFFLENEAFYFVLLSGVFEVHRLFFWLLIFI